MLSSGELESNLSRIQERIQKSAERCGRAQDEIKLIAVTKGFPHPVWDQALQHSLTCIGESRVQEIITKSSSQFNREKIELHFIGRLQSNKARKAVELTDVIQTVDSVKLINRLNKTALETNKKQRIYLQVNIGLDPNKTGFTPDETLPAAEIAASGNNLLLEGIMTIPPLGLSIPHLEKLYAETREIRDKILEKITPYCTALSMGMSGDYETAIAQGATHIRIGTALFGPRPQ